MFILKIANVILATSAFMGVSKLRRSAFTSTRRVVRRSLLLATSEESSVCYDDPSSSGFGSSGDNGNRRMVIAGNWKLNPTSLSEASNLLKQLSTNFVNHRGSHSEGEDASMEYSVSIDGEDDDDDHEMSAAIAMRGERVREQARQERLLQPEVVVFPPFPFLSEAIRELEGTGIKVGAQNVGLQTKGAYTGEVSASMIRSIGCEYVMLGHSERRTVYEETDSEINKKLKLCLEEQGLNVILCIGETEDEYENNLLKSVVDVQIKKAFMGITNPKDLDRIVVAYEPVWAIGTGRVATPEQAQTAHMAIRNTLFDLFGTEVARKVRIQYGGSVNPGNVDDLLSMPDVDGALVGVASHRRLFHSHRGWGNYCSSCVTERTTRTKTATASQLSASPRIDRT